MVALSGRGWKLAPSLVSYVKEADRLWPNRDRTSDGSIGDQAHASRASDHNPYEGWVHAVDLDEDLAAGTDLKSFAEHLRQVRDPRIRYVIYEDRIFKSYVSDAGPAWLWYRYSGPNAHLHHLHLSINRTATARDNLSPWFPSATPPANNEEFTVAQYDDIISRLDAINKKVDDIVAGILTSIAEGREFDDDVPENLTDIAKELRLNVRTVARKVGVPESEIVA